MDEMLSVCAFMHVLENYKLFDSNISKEWIAETLKWPKIGALDGDQITFLNIYNLYSQMHSISQR